MAAVESPQRRGETPTHEVLNQPPPLEDYDVARSDPVLIEGVERYGAPWDDRRAVGLGRLAGSARVDRPRLRRQRQPAGPAHP